MEAAAGVCSVGHDGFLRFPPPGDGVSLRLRSCGAGMGSNSRQKGFQPDSSRRRDYRGCFFWFISDARALSVLKGRSLCGGQGNKRTAAALAAASFCWYEWRKRGRQGSSPLPRSGAGVDRVPLPSTPPYWQLDRGGGGGTRGRRRRGGDGEVVAQASGEEDLGEGGGGEWNSTAEDMEGMTVGFVGAGQMAEALARGFHKAGLVRFEKIVVSDVAEVRRDLFKSLGATTFTDGVKVAECSDVLFIAVKPHVVKSVLMNLRESDKKIPLVVSIAAGITLSDLEAWVGDGARVIRVMPNTPCLVGETAAAMSLGKHATKEDADCVKKMLESVGKIYTVEERLLDAVTGLSGSGPAYVFVMIEALADGGVMAGLPRDIALSLAAQTVLGAAKMVLETGKHPGQLKDSVCSPGGTTIAAIREMEKGAFRGTVMNAVLASARRSKEMSESK